MGEILSTNSRFKMIFTYLILGLALIQYQNCAPSSDVLDQEGESHADVIDQVQVGEISFAQNKISAFLDENVIVLGMCDQSGSMISWSLASSDGQFIERGLSECDLGAFEVALSNQWQDHCDDSLILSAALGAKSSSKTTVEANCN